MAAGRRRDGAAASSTGLLPAGHLYVKICGIRDPAVAAAAAAFGADAVGLLFAPSPRRIEPNAAAAVVRAAKNVRQQVLAVGVFVDAEAEDIDAALAGAGLDAVQLHGEASPAFCRQLRDKGLGVIRALPAGAGLRQQVRRYRQAAHAVLVDSPAAGGGGSGRTFAWELAASSVGEMPVIVAGGLHAGNVTQLLSQLGPAGVDVSSGVESTPGQKSTARVRTFIDTVRRWERRR